MHDEVVTVGDLHPSPITPSTYALVSASVVTPPRAASAPARARWGGLRRHRDPVPTARRAPANGGVHGRITTGSEARDALTVTSPPHHGSVTVAADGTFTYLPRTADRHRASARTPVVDTFRAVVSDDRGRRSAVAIAPIVTAIGHSWPVAYTANSMGSTSVTVDEHPCGLALSADGRRLFTVSATASSVVAVDTETMTVLGSVALIGRPSDLALDRATGRLYVTLPELHIVEVVDVATLEVVDAIGLTGPRAVAVVDGRAVVVATDAGEIVTVDVTDHAILARVGGCGRPRALVLTADARTALVVDESTTDARLHLVGSPLRDPRPAGTFRADGFVFDVAVSPDGTRAHFVEDGTRSLMTVDLTTMAVVATTPLETFHTGVAVTADGRWVIVAAAFDDCVRVVDTETGAVTSAAVTGEFARHVLTGPDGRGYVTTAAGVTAIGGPIHGSVVADDAAPCRFTLAAAPARGTVTVSEDGAFVYVPGAPLVDGDSFTVTVEDGRHAPVQAVVPVIAGLPGSVHA
ncbi:YncE family protein [Williamsia serinedens]|uniref:DNA-binding beta-propeller fold protein YncE n=1 Tax=Williamsia serinedens TaxID=391736 RepID=A0ABT1H1J7_9NOCA|nr:Ig-like domain-containing protein [Williamsia serinedens]MCP2160854.1 hypothetical protein [Williamsia serinedens]